MSKEKETGKLSDYIRKVAPDHELAENVEEASRRLRKAKLRKVKV